MKRDSVSAYAHMKCDTPLLLYAPGHILDEPPAFPQLCTYSIDGLFLNQETNKNIRILYLLKYKHSKKYIYKHINGSVGPKIFHLIQSCYLTLITLL